MAILYIAGVCNFWRMTQVHRFSGKKETTLIGKDGAFLDYCLVLSPGGFCRYSTTIFMSP